MDNSLDQNTQQATISQKKVWSKPTITLLDTDDVHIKRFSNRMESTLIGNPNVTFKLGQTFLNGSGISPIASYFS